MLVYILVRAEELNNQLMKNSMMLLCDDVVDVDNER